MIVTILTALILTPSAKFLPSIRDAMESLLDMEMSGEFIAACAGIFFGSYTVAYFGTVLAVNCCCCDNRADDPATQKLIATNRASTKNKNQSGHHQKVIGLSAVKNKHSYCSLDSSYNLTDGSGSDNQSTHYITSIMNSNKPKITIKIDCDSSDEEEREILEQIDSQHDSDDESIKNEQLINVDANNILLTQTDGKDSYYTPTFS